MSISACMHGSAVVISTQMLRGSKPAMPGIWDLRARSYDRLEASELRRGPAKVRLFRWISGKVLFLAVGTGVDIQHFPRGSNIVAIDISAEMLRRASNRSQDYDGILRLIRTDAMALCFRDDAFDTVVTSCTLCSVPDPAAVLREIFRVLRPAGRLLMFEHVRSRDPILGLTLDVMSFFTRRSGTEMNRNTLSLVQAAGFRVEKVESIFLDIILGIHASKTIAPDQPAGC